mgnify:CR=1 FL=1
MSQLVRIGVAGVGRIGKMHAEIIARGTPGALLVAVADLNEAAAEAVASELGVQARSVEALIASDDIDAIAICTSTDTHVDLIVAAAEHGKAIFCEKPISLNLAEVDRALQAVADHDVKFMVGFNRRFDPAHDSVAAAVNDGTIGAPQLATITSRDPAPPPIEYVKVSGGIFVDMMIHDFDMARFVVGSPVVEVYAKGSCLIDPAIGEAGDVDTAMVLLTHANGCLTTINNSRKSVYGYDQRVEVFGANGRAMSDNPPVHTGTVLTGEGSRGTVIPNFFIERYHVGYVNEWTAFARYVLEGGDSPVSGRDGKAPVVIAMAAGESLRTGLPVKVSEG